MEQKRTMRVWKGPNGWMVTDNDPIVLRTFGTNTFPTAYTALCPAQDVVRYLRRLNPTAEIILV